MTNDNRDMAEIFESEPELEAAIPDEESVRTEEQSAPEPDKTELDSLKDKNRELNDKYLRLMAEYDNFRKRSQKERDDIYPSAMAAAVGKFLPALDSLERAAEFPHGDDEFGKGFDLICQSFREILTSMGVEKIGEVGEAFDAAKHHAVMHIEDESLGENVVAAVLQTGYMLGDKVIRYAMVQTAN